MWKRVGVLLVVAGCGSDTDARYGWARATFQNGQLELLMQVHERDPFSNDPYSQVADADVRATFRGQDIELAQGVVREFRSEWGYAAMVPVSPPVAADERVEFTIDGDIVGGTTPPPFEITAPASPHTSEDVTVTWTPVAADKMSWWGIACEYDRVDGPIPTDTGRLTFPPGALVDEAFGCEVNLHFERSRSASDATPANYWIQVVQSVPVTLEMTR